MPPVLPPALMDIIWECKIGDIKTRMKVVMKDAMKVAKDYRSKIRMYYVIHGRTAFPNRLNVVCNGVSSSLWIIPTYPILCYEGKLVDWWKLIYCRLACNHM